MDNSIEIDKTSIDRQNMEEFPITNFVIEGSHENQTFILSLSERDDGTSYIFYSFSHENEEPDNRHSLGMRLNLECSTVTDWFYGILEGVNTQEICEFPLNIVSSNGYTRTTLDLRMYTKDVGKGEVLPMLDFVFTVKDTPIYTRKEIDLTKCKIRIRKYSKVSEYPELEDFEFQKVKEIIEL